MASEICARADILSLNICTLLREHMRVHVRGTHARNAGSCRECGRQRTLETGINVPLWQRYIKQQAPRLHNLPRSLITKASGPNTCTACYETIELFPVSVFDEFLDEFRVDSSGSAGNFFHNRQPAGIFNLFKLV